MLSEGEKGQPLDTHFFCHVHLICQADADEISGPELPQKSIIDNLKTLLLLSKRSADKILLVQHQPMTRLYALKVLKKRHVLAQQELIHTLMEQYVPKS